MLVMDADKEVLCTGPVCVDGLMTKSASLAARVKQHKQKVTPLEYRISELEVSASNCDRELGEVFGLCVIEETQCNWGESCKYGGISGSQNFK